MNPSLSHSPSPVGTTPRRGLGRGLGSLIPTLPSPAVSAQGGTTGGDATAAPSRDHGGSTPDPRLREVAGAAFAELPVLAIAPNPRQPRQVFDDDAMAELVTSIREVGLLQPVVVRPSGFERYELVMGERRWRAVRAAGMETIPAIVRDTDDDVMLRDALLENLHRSQLNPLEEAAAYQQLLDDFGCTQEDLATRIGRSRPQVTNTLRLLKLSAPVQRRVAAGVLSAGHARALVSVSEAEDQEQLASRVVAEGISVRGLEELIALRSSAVPGPVSGPGRSGRAAQRPEYAEIATRLGDRYDTRVRIDGGRGRGRITLEFASPEDLQRILALLEEPCQRR